MLSSTKTRRTVHRRICSGFVLVSIVTNQHPSELVSCHWWHRVLESHGVRLIESSARSLILRRTTISLYLANSHGGKRSSRVGGREEDRMAMRCGPNRLDHQEPKACVSPSALTTWSCTGGVGDRLDATTLSFKSEDRFNNQLARHGESPPKGATQTQDGFIRSGGVDILRVIHEQKPHGSKRSDRSSRTDNLELVLVERSRSGHTSCRGNALARRRTPDGDRFSPRH